MAPLVARHFRHSTYVELITLHIFEIEGDRVLPGFGLVDVAYPMRCQIDLAILVIWQFVFARDDSVRAPSGLTEGISSRQALTPHTTPHCLAQRVGLHRAGTRAAKRSSNRCALKTFVIVGGRLSQLAERIRATRSTGCESQEWECLRGSLVSSRGVLT